MPKKLYTSVPPDYAVCIHDDCPLAKGCLHQIAYPQLLPERDTLRLVNPERCTKNTQCPYYRDAKPVRYAKGFTQIQKHMFPDQYDQFSKLLIAKFGRNPYYERRKGLTVLSPKEQELILDMLRKVGADDQMDFDSYLEATHWYD